MEVEQASLTDGVALDAVSLGQDGGGATAVDVGGSEVAQALVTAPVVVVVDEGDESAVGAFNRRNGSSKK